MLLGVTLPGDVVDAAKGLFGATTIGGFSNDMVATLDDLSSSDAAEPGAAERPVPADRGAHDRRTRR